MEETVQKPFGAAKQVGRTRTLNPIEPRIRELIEANEFYVLRRKRTHEALNVSYSRFGLRWTTDRNRNLSYFRSAQLRHRKDVLGNYVPYFHKNISDGLEKSSNVYIEKFIPRDHYKDSENGASSVLDPRLQVAEYIMTSKALKMLYWVPDTTISIYSSDGELEDEEAPNTETI